MIHAQGFEIIPQWSKRSGRIFLGVMIVLLILFLAICWVSASAQTPDDLKRAQERLTLELQSAQKEVEALRRETSRIAAAKKQSETEKETLVEEVRRGGAEVAKVNQALIQCQAEVADRDREIAALKKNVKRRALLRLLTFRF